MEHSTGETMKKTPLTQVMESDARFMEHAIPAFSFLAFGLWGLVIVLIRTRNLSPGQSYCETHIPERNTLCMKIAATLGLVCIAIGILAEGIMSCTSHNSLTFHQCFFLLPAGHQALYSLYGSTALVALLEVAGRLPTESARCSLIATEILAYVLWREHAYMITDPTSLRMHLLVAQVTLAHVVVFSFSVLRPKNIVAYVAQFSLYVLKGLWLVTVDWYLEHSKFMTLHQVGPYFVMESLLVYIATVLGAVCFNGQAARRPEGQRADTEYKRLTIPRDEETEN